MENRSFINKIGEFVPIVQWLPAYKWGLFKWDLIAGITLATFILPSSMAYAKLAGLPPQVGIYCCIAGGLMFAFFTTSKHVAVGPTSSISLVVGSTIALLSGGDPTIWAGMAALTALVVAAICFIAYLFRLSSLVNFISDSILIGFKTGAALTIMITQLPQLFGVKDGSGNFFGRVGDLFVQLPQTNWVVFAFGIAALLLLILGDKFFPGRPVSLIVVLASILVITFSNLPSYGLNITGEIPSGLPEIKAPSLRLHDVDSVLALAFACFLMGYIEAISAARTFASQNNYTIQPRQELLSMSFANLGTAFTSGYAVSGGLSQTIINERAGAKTPISLVICSLVLVLILMFLMGLLKNLPEVMLAAIVIHAVAGLIKIKELKRIYNLNKAEFGIAMIAVTGVLILGILKGVMLAVLMSLILVIMRISKPNVVVLGRIGNSTSYSDVQRHPDNILLENVLIIRIEASVLYFNADYIHERILERINQCASVPKMLILDLAAASFVDVSGSTMLVNLSAYLERKGIKLQIVEALSNVRDILRKQGMEEIVGHISRRSSIDGAVQEYMEQSKQ